MDFEYVKAQLGLHAYVQIVAGQVYYMMESSKLTLGLWGFTFLDQTYQGHADVATFVPYQAVESIQFFDSQPKWRGEA